MVSWVVQNRGTTERLEGGADMKFELSPLQLSSDYMSALPSGRPVVPLFCTTCDTSHHHIKCYYITNMILPHCSMLYRQ